MSFSFGTPSSAPATTGLTGGFSFGANKPTTTGFGLTAPSQPFGTTPATSAPAFGTPSFGSTSFGTTTAPSFGTSAPAFGTTSTAPVFGNNALAFGAATSTSTAPAFGTTQATVAPFGATTTPSFGLGTGLNFGAGTNTSATATGLSFGAPATSNPLQQQPATGFGLTGTTPGLGLFSSNTTNTTSSLFGPTLGTTSVTGIQPSTSATPSFGLGGASTTSGIGAASTTTDAKTEPPKQQKLPNEILTTVEAFKEFVKKQKALSSEVMRVSIKPLHTVSRETEAMLREAASLNGSVSRGRAASRRQRAAAAAALAAAEPAQRAGSELESAAPPAYVKELIAELEQQLITFRRQMDIADKQMQSSPKLLTEQELNQGFRRMHESLVALAGRLQAVHTQVEAQKEQYLNLRKYILKDPTNVFDTPTSTSSLDQILKDVDSGRKKMKSTNILDGSSILSEHKAALGNISQLAGPSPFGYVGGLSPFPDNSASVWQPQAAPTPNTSLNLSGFNTAPSESGPGFQLQKPPGKRGKQ